jgi:hypothetical protein
VRTLLPVLVVLRIAVLLTIVLRAAEPSAPVRVDMPVLARSR